MFLVRSISTDSFENMPFFLTYSFGKDLHIGSVAFYIGMGY